MFSRILLTILILLSPIALSAASATVQSWAYVTLSYTLKVDGKVQETNNSFSNIIGNWQLINWFENWIIGMKAWESKKIIVPPEQWYGTWWTTQLVSNEDIAPVFIKIIDKNNFSNSLREKIERSNLPDSMKSAKIGDVLTGSNNTTAKVIEASINDVTLEIQNKNNPFYKKSKRVWSVTRKDGVIYKIIKSNTDTYTLQVKNANSPFYKKRWVIGATAKTSNSSIIKLIKKNSESVEVEIMHPMVGKTLEFDVKIISIK